MSASGLWAKKFFFVARYYNTLKGKAFKHIFPSGSLQGKIH